MGLLDFLGRALGREEYNLKGYSLASQTSASYQALAIAASINLIAKTISRAEFKTFKKGKVSKESNYYIFNVEANKNKSASLFWREVVTKLLNSSEALILINDRQLYLADSFEKVDGVFEENIYKNIVINNKRIQNRFFYESEVLYLKDNMTAIKASINSISNDFSKLITSSIKGYQRSKSRKGKLNIPANLSKTKEAQAETQKHINDIMKNFMDPDQDSVLPETNGMVYTEIDEAKGSKSNDSGRETKNFADDIFDFVAIAFGIPPSLLKGDTVDTKDALNNFLTFCINPLAKLIQDEINRKMYKQKLYIERSYLQIDTTKIKAVDLKDIANSIDLLVRNGAFTIDDTLKTLGLEEIGGDIGGLRVMTKNNEAINEFMKGGD